MSTRVGIHAGEVEVREGRHIGGIAVHFAARVLGEAAPGEIVCTRTVKELVAGSGLAFQDRGARLLKGIPETWELYAVGGPYGPSAQDGPYGRRARA